MTKQIDWSKVPEERKARIETLRTEHEERQKRKVFIQHHKQLNGIRFMHEGDVVLAYRFVGRRRIEVAGAIRHKNDRFNLIDGQHLALNRLLKGGLPVRITPNAPVKVQLYSIMRVMQGTNWF